LNNLPQFVKSLSTKAKNNKHCLPGNLLCFYLCHRILVRNSVANGTDEKGIRCKTGAVPAAVNPIRQLADCFIELQTTDSRGPRREGINKRDEPEDLPEFYCYIKLRDKSLRNIQEVFFTGLSKAP